MRGLHLGTHPSTTPSPGGGSGSSRITFIVVDDVLYLTDPVTGYVYEAPVTFVGPTTLPSGLITAEADTLLFHYAGGTWSSPASQVEGTAPVGGSIINDTFYVTIASVTYSMPVTPTSEIPGVPPGGDASLVVIDGIEYLRIVFPDGEVRYEQVHETPTPDAEGGGGGGSPPSDLPYDPVLWDGNLNAATKNVLRDKFESIPLLAGINIKSFGATGDGSTDDTDAIKAAIASISANGGTVFAPCGTYLISDSITITCTGLGGTSVRFVGEGPATVFVPAAGLAGKPAFILQYLTELSDVFVNNSGAVAGIYGVRLDSSNCILRGIRIDHCARGITIDRMSDDGVYYTRGFAITIQNCGFGIVLKSTDVADPPGAKPAAVNGNQFYGIKIAGCLTAGVYIDQADGNAFEGSIEACTGFGIHIESGMGNYFNTWLEDNVAGNFWENVDQDPGIRPIGTKLLLLDNDQPNLFTFTDTTLAAPTVIGSPVVTVASASTIAKGKWIRIEDAATAPTYNLTAYVVSITGTSVTLSKNATAVAPAGSKVFGPTGYANTSNLFVHDRNGLTADGLRLMSGNIGMPGFSPAQSLVFGSGVALRPWAGASGSIWWKLDGVTAWIIKNNADTDILTIKGDGKIEVIDEAYNPTTWDGNLSVPTKNAVRDALSGLSGAINVRSYGATGAGIVDESSFIQAAINAVPAGGGAVYLPTGTYRLGSTTLVLPDGVTLRGDGPGFHANGGSKFYYTGTGTALSLGNECHVENITFQGSDVYPTTTGMIAIKPALNTYRNTVKNCCIIGYTKGIALNRTWINSFEDVIISNCTVGFSVEGDEVNAINIIGGEFSQNGKGVLIAEGAHNGIHFSGVTIEDNVTHGIHVTAGVDGANIFTNLVVDKCYFETNGPAAGGGYDILLDGPFLRCPVVTNNFFCSHINLVVNAATGAQVHGNDFRPLGDVSGRKTIQITSAAAVNTFIGPNTYEYSAYNPATDNAGTGTFGISATGTVGFTSSDSAGIAAGKVKGFVVCPYAATISGWSIVVDAGTCSVKVWKIASGTAKPTSSINTSGVAIATGTAIISTTLTDFTTLAVAANDIFAFEIVSPISVTEITFQLKLTKS